LGDSTCSSRGPVRVPLAHRCAKNFRQACTAIA
jgi:hypothetical protein